ncbi:MAG TPA: hypothetical protein VMK12_31750, partial [Anaeromyxobacteraceae bacterium]|nr:hypothetical protein [Anaeromyxobacteraceae bacterium]
QGREALSFAAAGLAGVEQVLAGGSGEVWDTLSQADAAAAFARGASAGQSPEGSALAAETQRWLDASQQALERGDLYWARMTVRAARQAADRALSFLPPGAGGGASGGAPPSEY